MKSCWGWWRNSPAKGQLRSFVLGASGWKGKSTDGRGKQGLLFGLVVFGGSLKPTSALSSELIPSPLNLLWVHFRRGLQQLSYDQLSSLTFLNEVVSTEALNWPLLVDWFIDELGIRIWNCPMHTFCHRGLGKMIGAELAHIFANMEPKCDTIYFWEH